MATKIYDGDDNDFYIKASEDEKWYRIKFEKDGKANFFLSFDKKSANLDLYLCEEDDDLGSKIGESRNGAGENETIFNVDVKAYKYYYICVKNRFGSATKFLLRAKIYAETDAAKIAKSMPLTKAFNLEKDIPSNLSIDYELANQTVMTNPIKINFSAGVYSNPSSLKCSLNFANPQPFLINGTTYGFVDERVENIKGLGPALDYYLRKKGFGDVTFSMGNVTVYGDGTFTVSAFQLQDAHALGSGKYVYTRLNCSKDIDLNNFKADLEYCIKRYGKPTAYAFAFTVGIAIAAAVVAYGIPLELAGIYMYVISIITQFLNTAV